MRKIFFISLIIIVLLLPISMVYSASGDFVLTEEESNWLNSVKNETFTFATENSDNSKYFYNIDGELDGQAIDIVGLIEEELNINIEIIPYQNISNFIDSIENDTKDIYFGPLKNETRTKYLQFIEPTTYQSYKLISSNRDILSLFDLKNTTIGFIENDYIFDKVQKK